MLGLSTVLAVFLGELPLQTNASAIVSQISFFKCASDADCELLGRCEVASGVCKCAPGFAGQSCGRIDLLAANPENAIAWPLKSDYEARSASGWGMTITTGGDGKYHGIVNVGCGSTCTHVTGTFAAHVVAPDPEGSFEFVGMVAPPTSFNPHIITSPNGTFVLYFRVNDQDEHRICTGAGDNNATIKPYIPKCGPNPDRVSSDCVHAGNPEDGVNIYVAWADSPSGPWHSQNVTINGAGTLHKSNPSATFLKDGRVLLSYRFNLNGEQVGFAIGSNMTGPFQSISNLSHSSGNDEDSYLWTQPDDTLHIIYHNGPHGYHAFSRGDADNFEFQTSAGASGNAFELDVSWSNGSTTKMKRRERPEMLFDAKTGAPKLLFTAVESPDGRTFNLRQPING